MSNCGISARDPDHAHMRTAEVTRGCSDNYSSNEHQAVRELDAVQLTLARSTHAPVEPPCDRDQTSMPDIEAFQPLPSGFLKMIASASQYLGQDWDNVYILFLIVNVSRTAYRSCSNVAASFRALCARAMLLLWYPHLIPESYQEIRSSLDRHCLARNPRHAHNASGYQCLLV